MIKTLRSLLSYAALATIVLLAVVTTQLGSTQKTVAAQSTTSLYVYVSPTGSDNIGNGSLGNPFRTLAYAAKLVQPNQNYTIYLNPGVYRETEATVLPPGVNIEGAGESRVTITSNGAIPAPGVNTGTSDWSLWHYGSINPLLSLSQEYNKVQTLERRHRVWYSHVQPHQQSNLWTNIASGIKVCFQMLGVLRLLNIFM